MAAAVAVSAVAARVSLVEGCLLVLCVTIVLAAETFNTALEFLAREITSDQRPGIGAALDIASGAVLLASVGSALVGSTVFGYRLGVILHWWT
jgi:diacylglycerol kinase